MKKLLLSILPAIIVFLLSCNPAYAAIALDSSADLGFSFTSNLTTAYTVTGSNPILFVGGWGGSVAGTDNWTGVTYNGVSMTRVAGFYTTNTGRWFYLYALPGPATGSHNVIVSETGTSGIDASAVSYTGAAQSGQPTTFGTSTLSNTSPMAIPLTTTVDNSWTLMYCHINGGTATPTAGTTLRETGANGVTVYDSNGPKSPIGTYNIGFTFNSPNGVNCIGTAFAPLAVAPVLKPVGNMIMGMAF